jgi:hypothetical protein
MYWGPDSKSLVMVNEPQADIYKLFLFDTKTLSSGRETSAADRIDEMVKQALFQKLGQGRHIAFYLPRFVSWKASDLVMAVGGATSSGGDGPTTPYCYGFLKDSSTQPVRDVLSVEGLKTKFRAECRVSP